MVRYVPPRSDGLLSYQPDGQEAWDRRYRSALSQLQKCVGRGVSKTCESCTDQWLRSYAVLSGRLTYRRRDVHEAVPGVLPQGNTWDGQGPDVCHWRLKSFGLPRLAPRGQVCSCLRTCRDALRLTRLYPLFVNSTPQFKWLGECYPSRCFNCVLTTAESHCACTAQYAQ